MRIIPKKTLRLKGLLVNHIKDNLKAYIITSLILLVGITLGVFFVNGMSESQQKEVQNYLTSFTTLLKENTSIDTSSYLKKSLANNILLAVVMWFVGSTVIGIPIVFGLIAFRGFCLGYTISSGIAVWGTEKGILFFITSMLLQNLIFIPCILALAVSGIKLYQSIIKDKRKENVKFEIFRHTIFSSIILIFLVISSFIEAYISSNLLIMYVPYM